MSRHPAHAGVLGLVCVGLWACGEPLPPPLPGTEELALISIRTLKSDVLEALPTGPRPEGEGVQKGYRVDRYFVEGGWLEVLWLEPTVGLQPGANPRESLNPVIFRDDILEGWGWEHFDVRAAELGLSIPEPASPAPSGPTPAPTSI